MEEPPSAAADTPRTTPPPVERHGYAPPPGRRIAGLIGTGAIYALVMGGFLFAVSVAGVRTAAPSTLSVFDVEPPAAPPEPMSEVPPGPVQVERQEPRPAPQTPMIDPPEIRLGKSDPAPIPAPVPDPGLPVEKTTAPEARPAPAAPQASTGKPTWEGLVLAALNKVKRYPPDAQFARRQGVPWIRLTMDRQGRVLSVMLERGSGIPSLDREALALPRRASPLPKPPEDVPGAAIELIVPVEFFMR